MCCESCPDYEQCAVKDKLKHDCCKECPDYGVCYSDDSEGYMGDEE